MWRNIAKQSISRKIKFFSQFSSTSASCSLSQFPQESLFQRNTRFGVGFDLNTEVGTPENGSGKVKFGYYNFRRSYASVAEAISISSTDTDEDDDLNALLSEMQKGHEDDSKRHQKPKLVGGMGLGKYNTLRKKQVKWETEAWEEAAKEYQELLEDMCEQKLAPNLPYMKSLFLGWFEPLRDSIAAEQELCRQGKNRGNYAPYFDHLPADKMAVLTMHKLMGLLMTGGGTGGGAGSCRVVQAASQIGEGIENEVHYLKTKKEILSFSHFLSVILILVETQCCQYRDFLHCCK